MRTKQQKLAPPPRAAGPNKYFLHVLPDGTELKFTHKPDLPCMLVKLLPDGVEQVYMSFVEGKSEGPERRLVPLTPHGRGWTLFEPRNKSNVWRRTLSSGAENSLTKE